VPLGHTSSQLARAAIQPRCQWLRRRRADGAVLLCRASRLLLLLRLAASADETARAVISTPELPQSYTVTPAAPLLLVLYTPRLPTASAPDRAGAVRRVAGRLLEGARWITGRLDGLVAQPMAMRLRIELWRACGSQRARAVDCARARARLAACACVHGRIKLHCKGVHRLYS
jgi:hypothetical protein